MKKNIFWIISLCGLLFSGCIKENPKNENTGEPSEFLTGIEAIMILNQGTFNMNNASISYYDVENRTLLQDYFTYQNNRQLGDVANDIKMYGQKIYIIVNNSSQLEVMDIKGKSIKQMPLFNANQEPRQPRNITFHQGKAYVCSFDGTVVKIDTASLTIEGFVQVGKNPEDLCVANHKLYVANSGGLDFINYDKTVSVIDLNSFSVIKTIEVMLNPNQIMAGNDGNVYLLTRGNYSDIKYGFQKISTITDSVVHTYAGVEAMNMAISGNTAYLYDYNSWGENPFVWIKTFDLQTGTDIRNPFITDGTKITAPYGIHVDDKTGNVYITDANNFTASGKVYCFDASGKKLFSLDAGITPSKILLIRK